MSEDKKHIPIDEAIDLADRYDLTHVVIFCHQDHDGDRDHIVTYGRSVEQCEEATRMGNHLKEVMGWPENLKEYPSRVKEMEKEIKRLKDEVESLEDEIGGP